MNQVSEDSKIRVNRVLAVIGFAVIVVLLAWLAVQVVRLTPNAFSSLAVLLDSIQEDRIAQNELIIESDQNVANTNESFTVAWKDMHRNGFYAISYDCVEGVSLEARLGGEIVPIECDEHFILPQDKFSIDLRFTSEKERFVDVPYQIVFIKDGEVEPAFVTELTVTLVNASIPNGVALGDDTPNDKQDTEEDTDVSDNTDTSVHTNETYWKTVTTYTKPVSDPNGYTDLSVKLLGIGYVNSAKNFVKLSAFEEGEPGAYQFEVRNIGTKTSSTWRFEAEMPDGNIFKSKIQTALKPKEVSILTVSFPDPGDEGTEIIAAEVFGGGDTTPANNGFRIPVRIED